MALSHSFAYQSGRAAVLIFRICELCRAGRLLVVTHIANFVLALMFAICELSEMAKPSLNAKIISLGVSKSYASQIVAGVRAPSLPLALRIFRELGLKFGPLVGATKAEISALEKMSERERVSARAA